MNGQKRKSSRRLPYSLSNTFSNPSSGDGGRQTQPNAFPSSFGIEVGAASGRVRALAFTWPRATAASTGLSGQPPHSSKAPFKATQPPPLSPFLHPRLGTKDFKFWLRCSSREHQTSTTWKPGTHVTVWGKHECTNTGSPESLSSSQAATLGWVSALPGPTRRKSRWFDLSLGVGYLSHFTIWGEDRNSILYGHRDATNSG